jgi:hypothetical protein
MTLYQIACADLAPEHTLLLFRTALTWAAAQGNVFEIGVEPDVYDDPQEVADLMALGQSVHAFNDGAASRSIRGVPNEAFVLAMTTRSAPSRARAGDECPVEYVSVESGARHLYISYDYGTVQVLDVNEAELSDLQRALGAAGLPPITFWPIRPPRAP